MQSEQVKGSVEARATHTLRLVEGDATTAPQFRLSTRLDVTPIITHRFSLDHYRDAFMACWDQGSSGAVKVLFTFQE